MRIDPVDVAGPLENVAFHSVHHVVLPGVLDKIVMGLGAACSRGATRSRWGSP